MADPSQLGEWAYWNPGRLELPLAYLLSSDLTPSPTALVSEPALLMGAA